MTKAVLLIGGAGFLGKTMLQQFGNRSDLVFSYADLKPLKDVPNTFYYADILLKESLFNISERFDIVINLTGQITNPINLCYRLNTEGIDNVIDFVHNQKTKLIQISTISVYGSSNIPLNESSILNPERPYGSLKAFAEYEIQKRLPQDQYCILRLSNLYGDSQTKGLLAYIIRSINIGDKLKFDNNGNMKRYFLNVLDASEIIVQGVERFNHGVFNLVGPDFLTIRAILDNTSHILNENIQVDYSEMEPWENVERIESSKICSVFDIDFNYNLNDFLNKKLARTDEY